MVVRSGGGQLSSRHAPDATSRAVAAVMRGNRKRDTGPELRLRSELHRIGLRFRKDHPIAVGQKRVRVDVAFTRQLVAVFVDGCFWHRCPLHGVSPKSNSDYWGPKLDRNVARDVAQSDELEAIGWKVVRIWEHEPPREAAARVRAVLAERRAPS